MWGRACLLFATESSPADLGISGAAEEAAAAGASVRAGVDSAAPLQAMTEINTMVTKPSKANAGYYI